MVTRYGTIVADPPWQLTFPNGRVRVPRLHGWREEVPPYEMMSVAQIKAIPVGDLADEEAHLYLWSSRRVFREGTAVAVARAWGFEPCGEIIWGLRNPGMGGFLGNGHEPVLLAQRGGLAFPKDMLPHGVEFWRQMYLHGKVHSAKPDALLDLAEQVSPAPRVELFARRARFGWDYWGDESLGTAEMPSEAA